MTAPLKAAAPGVRAASPRASAGGGPDSTAPFAAALDGAMTRRRAADPQRALDRGPSDRASERALERVPERAGEGRGAAEERDLRAADRTAAAARRAEDKAHRIADRADRTADRATGSAVRDAGPNPETPSGDAAAAVPGVATPDPDEHSTPATTPVTDPTAGGPAAVWALLLGSSLPPATPASALPTGPDAVAVPAVSGAATVDPTAAVLPAAVPGRAGDPSAGVPGSPLAEVAPATTVEASAAASGAAPFPAGASIPAAVSAVPTAATADGASGTGAAVPALPPGAAGAAQQVPDATAGAVAGAPTFVVVPDTGLRTGLPVAADGAAALIPPVGVPAAPGGEDPAASTATDSATGPLAVAPATGAPGEGMSTGTGGAGQDASSGAPSGNAPTSVAGVASAPTTVVAPAAASADAATGDAATLPVGSQVARQVAVLRGGPDGAHTMTLVLTPDTLGPVEVQVTVSKGTVDLTLRGAHEHGRAALLDSLPDLRRDLETAGLTCSRLEVDRDTGGSWLGQHSAQAQQQAFGERAGQQDRGERSRPWLRPADTTGSGPTPPSRRSTSSGVDLLV
jgi:flagellar hook-length control protein FliK